MENAQIPQFSVSDFLAVVNQSFEMAFGVVSVEGEIASFKVNQQKYVFFDLKDATGAVSCFMSIWQLRIPIEDGMRVTVRATPKVTPWGKFSLTIQEIRPVGEGSIKKGLEILRAKLDKEGLFETERKRSLPYMPSTVGVISSTAAAGYADFIKIADERFGGVHFMVAHVQVQGSGAADQIIRALDHFNQTSEPPEVIVIVRGGGSADDLAVFNDEPLVRAVASSRVPVLTGIGHETDQSLCDLAADAAASTPSNAAHLLLPDKHALLDRLQRERNALADVMEQKVRASLERVRVIQGGALEQWSQRIEYALHHARQRRELIREYDPRAVLLRGYAMISGTLKVGEVVNITTKNASMKARIEEYEERRISS